VRRIVLRDNTSEHVTKENVSDENPTSTEATSEESSLCQQSKPLTKEGYFDVRKNLFGFLDTYCSEVHSYVWIDQISID
jgi:hypothetical protein